MSDRYRLQYDGIDSRQYIDHIENGLNQLQGVRVEQVGINEAIIERDQHDTTPQDVERVVVEAGGTLRESHLLD